MAVDLCSSSSPAGSPRLSFSRDSPPPQPSNQEEDPPSPDFHFCLPTFADASLPAEELFYNGKLRLINHNGLSSHPHLHPDPLPPLPQRKDSLKEIIAAEDGAPSNPSKTSSFWTFGRSASLNCASGGAKPSGLLCSLRLLPRSKSVGSDPRPAPRQQRRPGGGATPDPRCLRKSSSASKAPSSYYYGPSSKGAAGVRISPVLNVPPAFSAKGGGGGGFLGLGHLFRSGREKGGGSSSKKKALFSGPS